MPHMMFVWNCHVIKAPPVAKRSRTTTPPTTPGMPGFFRDARGHELAFSSLSGMVVLVVNVASECSYLRSAIADWG
jgi:hypothetical protein